jgi:hypothetical protein
MCTGRIICILPKRRLRSAWGSMQEVWGSGARHGCALCHDRERGGEWSLTSGSHLGKIIQIKINFLFDLKTKDPPGIKKN